MSSSVHEFMSLDPVSRLQNAASGDPKSCRVDYIHVCLQRKELQELTLQNLVLVCCVKVDTKIQALSVETNELSKLPWKDFFSSFVEKKLKIYVYLDTILNRCTWLLIAILVV